ncbi:mechanosensitive ion channel family protein [Gynuella sp.]|uniref:mechanosensitive ion channel family protein n=1 Tax=Gynuella sp. TaxID=2969146 RepID=UPI003D0DEAEA
MNEALNSTGPMLGTISGAWQKIVSFMPNIAGAILLMVVGYFLARLALKVITSVVDKLGVSRLADTIGVTRALRRARIRRKLPELVGLVFFWVIILLFIVLSVEVLGLDKVSSALNEMLLYFPKVLAALVIIAVGLFIAQFIQGLVETAAHGVGLEYSRNLGKLAYAGIIIIVVSLAIGELDIETALLNAVIIITLSAFALAASLSLGLATKHLSKAIVSGVYVRELLNVGDEIEIDGQRGVVEEVSTLKTFIRLDDESLLCIPNEQLIQSTYKLIKVASPNSD